MRLTAAFAILAMVTLMPIAQAHGVAPDETFTLVLADDDGLIGYGGCTPSACVPERPRAHDAVAIEAREAANETGAPLLIFRLLVEPVDDDLTRGLVLSGMATAPFQVEVTVKGTSTTSSLGQAATPYMTANLTAIEVTLHYDDLGIRQGDTLQGIRLNTTMDGQVGDILPGGWYDGDTLVPHIPHEIGEVAEVAEDPALGTYSIKGPAPLLKVSVTFPAQQDDGWLVVVNITNNLGQGHQEVNVTALGVRGSAMVPAGSSAEVRLLLPFAVGNVTVRVHSDVGGYEESVVYLASVFVQESPGPGAWLALLAALAFMVRRRA